MGSDSEVTFPSLSSKFHVPLSQLVSVKLNEDNFLVWKQQILAAVRGYGLEGYLNGEKACPNMMVENQSEINPDYNTWVRQDQLIVSWLLSSLSEKLLVNTVGLDTSQEIWKSLEVSFANQSRAKVMHIKQQLHGMRKGTTSMRDYLSKIKSCCDTLNAIGHRITDDDQILYIMGGLGPDYNPVMVNVSSKLDPISVSDISSLLLNFESRLENVVSQANFSSEGSTPSINFTSQQGNNNTHYGRGRSNVGSGGNRGGNNTGKGPNRGGFRGRGGRGYGSNGPICQICFRTNHTAEKCFYRADLNYTPPSQQQNKQQSQNGNKNFSPTANVASFQNSNAFEDGSWYPDSGATNHVTYDFNNLNVGSEYHGYERVQMGNGAGPSHTQDSSPRGC